MKVWTDRDGRELTFKEFMDRWKQGIEGITPLQQTQSQLLGTKIIIVGIIIGHAVERLSGYTIPHGFCVSIGMMVEGRISRELGYFSESDLKRQQDLLVRAQLPIELPSYISDSKIINLTSRDKKTKDGIARYCLPVEIGKMHEFDGEYVTHVPKNIVKKALKETRK